MSTAATITCPTRRDSTRYPWPRRNTSLSSFTPVDFVPQSSWFQRNDSHHHNPTPPFKPSLIKGYTKQSRRLLLALTAGTSFLWFCLSSRQLQLLLRERRVLLIKESDTIRKEVHSLQGKVDQVASDLQAVTSLGDDASSPFSTSIQQNANEKEHPNGARMLQKRIPQPPPPQARVQRRRARVVLTRTDPIYTGGNEWDVAPVVLEEFKLLFYTQAKVGCTVWKMLFRRMMKYDNWDVENCCGLIPWNPKTNGLKYLYDYDLRTANKMLNDPHWTRAIFVRDPKERFLSAYLDKARQNPYFLEQQCCGSQIQCGTDTIYNAGQSPSAFFSFITQCDNAHWRPQSERLPTTKTKSNKSSNNALWSTINFVGHMETVAVDAERLLRLVGAWQGYGASGWGRNGTEGIFSTNTAKHATLAAHRLREFLTPELEAQLDRYYQEDYRHAVLNLTTTTTIV
jgi:Sulfotransferase family